MTGNPTLSESTFRDARPVTSGQTMTVQGAVNKTAILLVLAIVAAGMTWNFVTGRPGVASGLMIAGGIGGFILAMITSFKAAWSPVTAPIYAVLEGLFIGGISFVFNHRYPGIVPQAVLLTFGTLAALLAAYTTGVIRASDGLRRGIIAATGGIALVYLLSWILAIFHIQIPGIFSSGPIGIVFSLVVVVIAAMNLVLDFDFIESGARQGAAKYMEWYAGFGLLVTLIWLYLEILRLLAKMSGNRR
jgi:uncharacterized YccA/Bax inhibitor family protein